MKDRREHTRFDVSNCDFLSAKTVHSPDGERLLTLSMAGCGFVSFLDDFRFRIGDVIKIELIEDGTTKHELQGALLYCNPYPYNGQIGRFYGIRFLGDYERVIRPIVKRLETLSVEGKIARSN